MTQEERLLYLITYLLGEDEEYGDVEIPGSQEERRRLLRALMNVRPPAEAAPEFLRVQDAYLRAERERRKITSLQELTPEETGIYLWKGDITAFRADAIVNAANSALLGCFIPCHGCIDNAIHSAAGVQLRLACKELMDRQGEPEPVGKAKLTEAYNLPCRYVLHTVGPVIYAEVTQEHRALLASCYRSCLSLAASHGLKSVVFCCISTGEFHFPNEEAARIAVKTVREFLKDCPENMEVVFNVFQEKDYEIYKRLLRSRQAERGV